jgi:hypothetical protein
MTERVPRLAVPAYFRPDVRPGDWEQLARRAPQVAMVILNVANGPGDRPDPAFFPALERLSQVGVTVTGYVDTDYGRRPPAGALAELERFRRWYDVAGVCFDRAAGTAEQLGYYAALSTASRDAGAGVVVFNHGAHPVEAYAEHADLLGTFEGPWQAYTRLSVPRWTRSWPASRFEHVVYGVPPEEFGRALRLAAARHAGCAYVTDRGGANPYDRLPSPPGPPRSPQHWFRRGRFRQGLTSFGAD